MRLFDHILLRETASQQTCSFSNAVAAGHIAKQMCLLSWANSELYFAEVDLFPGENISRCCP